LLGCLPACWRVGCLLASLFAALLDRSIASLYNDMPALRVHGCFARLAAHAPPARPPPRRARPLTRPTVLAKAMRRKSFRPLASPCAGMAAETPSWPAGWPGSESASQVADRTAKRKPAHQSARLQDTPSSGQPKTQPTNQEPVGHRASPPQPDQPTSKRTNHATAQPTTHSHIPTRCPLGGGLAGFRGLAGWWIGGPESWWVRIC
jgi:hypothetical protein